MPLEARADAVGRDSSLTKTERDLRLARRPLAIPAALEGLSREAAARVAGMDRQTLRDWVIRYSRRGGPV
jgi:transposase